MLVHNVDDLLSDGGVATSVLRCEHAGNGESVRTGVNRVAVFHHFESCAIVSGCCGFEDELVFAVEVKVFRHVGEYWRLRILDLDVLVVVRLVARAVCCRPSPNQRIPVVANHVNRVFTHVSEVQTFWV